MNGLAWLKYLSLFYYYGGRNPLTDGISPTGLIVLAALTVVLTAIATGAMGRRDLRS